MHPRGAECESGADQLQGVRGIIISIPLSLGIWMGAVYVLPRVVETLSVSGTFTMSAPAVIRASGMLFQESQPVAERVTGK